MNEGHNAAQPEAHRQKQALQKAEQPLKCCAPLLRGQQLTYSESCSLSAHCLLSSGRGDGESLATDNGFFRAFLRSLEQLQDFQTLIRSVVADDQQIIFRAKLLRR